MQTVRTWQPAFSAAFIAHVEAAYDDERIKIELCTVVPLPDNDIDWLRMLAVLMKNNYVSSQDANLVKWLSTNRLEGGFIGVLAGNPAMDANSQALVASIRNNVKPAMAQLQLFLQRLK